MSETKITRTREKASAKFRQPPPVIDLDNRYGHPISISIEEAQQLRLQIDEALAQAERERMKRESTQSRSNTV